MKTLLAAPLLALLCASASAEGPTPKAHYPHVFSWIVTEEPNGAWVRVPMIDTDPNTGLTIGLMQVVAVVSSGTLRQAHIPTFSHNPNFGYTGGYEVYLFPSAGRQWDISGSFSQKVNRDFSVEYRDEHFLDRDQGFDGRLHYSRDGSMRFYGFGPATSSDGESNYTLDSINYRFGYTKPIRDGSPWKGRVYHRFQANDVTDGAVTKVPDLITLYPGVAQQVNERHNDGALGAMLLYDSRDSAVTTSRGAYAEVFVDASHKLNYASEYSYHRYGAELKAFLPNGPADDPEPDFITAGRARFEHLRGAVPVWLLPSMGGRHSNRAYGEGRFTSKGLAVIGIEERCRFLRLRNPEMNLSFWIDPFVEAGLVFREPYEIPFKYTKPAAGLALRAVGRTQFVASADFGYGQEGLKTFLDISYAF
ncbi:MAG TPA: hypothetical protein VNI01_14950 [Elusimicrobiota bacterium]|nr:hypothetical protein [Elusimicrobiota bacterium]